MPVGRKTCSQIAGAEIDIEQMKPEADSFRYELRSVQQLKELASAALPLELESSPGRRSFHRDLFLDTEDEALRQRGVICRLRIGADDSRTLSVRIITSGENESRTVESRVRSSEVREAAMENTDAGRMLKGLVYPALLKVRLELEVDRITRTADTDWLRRPRLELHYDEILARHDDRSRSFQQMCIHRRRGPQAVVRRLAAALETESGLAPVANDTREHAELLLRWTGNANRRDRQDHSDSTFPARREPVERRAVPDFFNPELSLLAFQLRVLALAEDQTTPLRERCRFLAIVTANVDEFHMIRMAGLKRAAREQYEEQCEDGLTHSEQLEKILELVADIVDRQQRCWMQCRSELEQIGLRFSRWDELSKEQRAQLREKCADEIHPSLTPMAMTLSPGHPVPHLPHLSLALAVVIRLHERDRLHLAEVELPAGTLRFLNVPGEALHVIPIEEVIKANLDLLYPVAQVEGAYVIRVTRGGDLTLDEDAADDLLDAVAEATEKRPRNPAIRLEVEQGTPEFVRELLLENLSRELGPEEVDLGPSDAQEIDGLIDLRSLNELPFPDAERISYPVFQGADRISANDSMFSLISARDLLFHHPFDSFAGTVIRFLEEAALDPHVTAIKITLYRTGDPSPVVEALLEAARRGKQVVAFVELKARFDEENNVGWARKLEDAGGHVVYGLVGLKNHAKVTLVVRREGGKLESYAHVGTGNYNSRSGMQYTDLSLFSSRNDLTSDVVDLFNALTGGSQPPRALSRGALVSPYQLMDEMLAHIEREASNARAGRPSRITAKFNGLSDSEVVRALYRASSDGVKVDLIVRGICTLRPGLPARSGNIRVASVVGQFLEHSRIYRFENAGDPVYYIGSPDFRPRNLRRRVELLVPVADPEHRAYLDHVLDLYLNDGTAWDLGASGEYTRRSDGKPGAQATFMTEAESRAGIPELELRPGDRALAG